MKLNFFSRTIKLESLEVETLKVAILDAFKQIEYERSLLDNESEQLTAVVSKAVRLQNLVQKLGLDDVSV